ncbi:MAG: sarcosine oxidase subunit delta [Pseudomonadota bacterium]
MQLFTCPFCGLRNETEFYFAGEAGKARPDTTHPISDEAWANYLFTKKNACGVVEEAWVHIPCKEMFVMRRDTVSMEVLETRALRDSAT